MELKHQQLSPHNQKAIKVVKKLPQPKIQTTYFSIMSYMFTPMLLYFFRQTQSSLHACVAMCIGRAVLSSGVTYCIQSQDRQTTAVSFHLFSSKHTSPWSLPLDSSIPHHTSTHLATIWMSTLKLKPTTCTILITQFYKCISWF